METRRHCPSVIQQMLDNVPAEKTDLIKDLRWNLEDAIYKAPEETLQWERTMETLERHIPEPKEEWEFKVISIFSTRTIEELKLHFKKS